MSTVAFNSLKIIYIYCIYSNKHFQINTYLSDENKTHDHAHYMIIKKYSDRRLSPRNLGGILINASGVF